ncbi:MAG: hypothetical protein COZ06_15790 [Armatimonadetes bacterium CG_4_10_14_3_um_filter_66_18]|nr:hypothetical protein [Armatimonadota bacterium]OIP09794.1 MAG: hypothetical protein AUJ96_04565 [Armatimonadetes bacterium CG2_30_66_41]PIU93425.1 MAG: hypothetical protein COS65_12895 [Armatimonadetes bacterium CG06_land_8_20_14_3_00_66_21]PIX39851.1 MAG: hypothetical protein COZ57_27300 [Armatimonadetes bacterium CG_4_8_14_3_um_filter_66_20]PIY48715.1 MAG: hypothetical protein COZ06_15790 [Armatimonadetes bacterium CG_4_10_14_3_um_filter_66_18]PIZ31266.1 MAG: hypothetical protein COY42_32
MSDDKHPLASGSSPMFSRYQRPLTAKERRALGRDALRIRRELRRLPWTALVGFLVIIGALWGWTILASHDDWRAITAFWLVIGIPIGLWAHLEQRKGICRQLQSLDEAIAFDSAEVVRIRATSMVKIEEVDDEGPCYAFEVGGEQIVFVEGQDFYPSARFPNTDLELVAINDKAGAPVALVTRKRGEKLRPLRTIAPPDESRFCRPAHLTTVSGRLADMDDILTALAAEA